MNNFIDKIITLQASKLENNTAPKLQIDYKSQIKKLSVYAGTFLAATTIGGIYNSTFPESATAQTKTEQTQSQDNTNLYIGLGALAAIGGVGGFLALNKNKETKQETTPFSEVEKPTSVFKPEIMSLEELFATESHIENRNTDYYKILLKRYSKEIKAHISQSFTTENRQGVITEMKSNAKLLNLISAAKEDKVLSDDFTISHLHKSFANGLVDYKEIGGVPVLIIKGSASIEMPKGSGVMLQHYNKIKGIIKFNKEDDDDIEINEVLKHEFIHLAFESLTTKIKVEFTEQNTQLYYFISEFLAYGASTSRFQFSPNMICRSFFYVDRGDYKYSIYQEISKYWSKILIMLSDETNDIEGVLRNRIKSYLINEVAAIDDIDFDNYESKTKFEKYIGINIDIIPKSHINWNAKILQPLSEENITEFEEILKQINTIKILTDNSKMTVLICFNILKINFWKNIQ